MDMRQANESRIKNVAKNDMQEKNRVLEMKSNLGKNNLPRLVRVQDLLESTRKSKNRDSADFRNEKKMLIKKMPIKKIVAQKFIVQKMLKRNKNKQTNNTPYKTLAAVCMQNENDIYRMLYHITNANITTDTKRCNRHINNLTDENGHCFYNIEKICRYIKAEYLSASLIHNHLRIGYTKSYCPKNCGGKVTIYKIEMIDKGDRLQHEITNNGQDGSKSSYTLRKENNKAKDIMYTRYLNNIEILEPSAQYYKPQDPILFLTTACSEQILDTKNDSFYRMPIIASEHNKKQKASYKFLSIDMNSSTCVYKPYLCAGITKYPSQDPYHHPSAGITIDPSQDPYSHPSANTTNNPSQDSYPYQSAGITIDPSQDPYPHPSAGTTKEPRQDPYPYSSADTTKYYSRDRYPYPSADTTTLASDQPNCYTRADMHRYTARVYKSYAIKAITENDGLTNNAKHNSTQKSCNSDSSKDLSNEQQTNSKSHSFNTTDSDSKKESFFEERDSPIKKAKVCEFFNGTKQKALEFLEKEIFSIKKEIKNTKKYFAKPRPFFNFENERIKKRNIFYDFVNLKRKKKENEIEVLQKQIQNLNEFYLSSKNLPLIEILNKSKRIVFTEEWIFGRKEKKIVKRLNLYYKMKNKGKFKQRKEFLKSENVKHTQKKSCVLNGIYIKKNEKEANLIGNIILNISNKNEGGTLGNEGSLITKGGTLGNNETMNIEEGTLGNEGTMNTEGGICRNKGTVSTEKGLTIKEENSKAVMSNAEGNKGTINTYNPDFYTPKIIYDNFLLKELQTFFENNRISNDKNTFIIENVHYCKKINEAIEKPRKVKTNKRYLEIFDTLMKNKSKNTYNIPQPKKGPLNIHSSHLSVLGKVIPELGRLQSPAAILEYKERIKQKNLRSSKDYTKNNNRI